MQFKFYLMVFIGGGSGAVLRFIISNYSKLIAPGFPFGTHIVNLLGSFLAGFLSGVLRDEMKMYSDIQPFLFIGFLGGFTTYSTFSLEAVQLLKNSQYSSFGYHFFLNTILSVSLALWGYNLSHKDL